ncbi:MAG: methyltransferase [Proteobacteria bacterium]|nr:methyltransferase [Pseudomonadota bacterium]
MKASPAADFERLYALGTGFQVAEILFAAIRLGFFSALAAGPVTGKSLAKKLNLSPDALGRFMFALKNLGLIEERNGACIKTPLSKNYLGAAEAENYSDMLIHLETLKSSWANLSYSLKKGTMHAPRKEALADYPRQLKRFLSAMHAYGAVKSAAICRLFPLHRYRHLLDIGGGMGTYAVAFAQKNSRLQATVFDLETVVPHAKKYIRQCGMGRRVSVAHGECRSDPFPGNDYDLVLLSNILHIYAPGDARSIIKKAARALQSSGTLLIHDYIAGCGDQVLVSLFDMTMLVGTPEGRCHARTDLCQWMKAAGLSRIRTKAVNAGTSIMWGIKK